MNIAFESLTRCLVGGWYIPTTVSTLFLISSFQIANGKELFSPFAIYTDLMPDPGLQTIARPPPFLVPDLFNITHLKSPLLIHDPNNQASSLSVSFSHVSVAINTSVLLSIKKSCKAIAFSLKD